MVPPDHSAALQEVATSEISRAHGLLLSGHSAEAVAILEALLARDPDLPGLHLNLAAAFLVAERPDQALQHYRHILSLDPEHAEAWVGVVRAETACHHAQQALDVAARCRGLCRPWPEMARAEAAALQTLGRLPEAVHCLASALVQSPLDRPLRAQLLLTLQYVPLPAAERERAHRAWMGLQSAIAAPCDQDGGTSSSLRLGLLSGDLRQHSVGSFAAALFPALPTASAEPPARRVERHVFSTLPPAPDDPIQAWFRQRADAWLEASALSNTELAAAIRASQIDVLIDLSGHTAGGRPALADHRPAPLLLSAIGYPGHPGHPAIAAHLVDSFTDPPADLPPQALPRLHLDPCFLCYTPPSDAPQPVLPEPEQPFTLGCFNQPAKISDATLALWAPILRALPEAQLLLKGRCFADADARRQLLERCGDVGIAPERISLHPFLPGRDQHLALYQQVHLALDTVPYNGTTTTCEALWMGVPVLTVAGDHHAARVGLSLLHAAGWPELVAASAEDLCDRAVAWARDRQALQRFRLQARQQLRASTLLDAEGYRQRFEALLLNTWQQRFPADRHPAIARPPSS